MKVTPGYLVLEKSVVWNPMATEGAIGKSWIKVFGRDPGTGATAALVKYEKGYTASEAVSQVYSDTLCISGKMKVGDKTFTKSSYGYRPAGVKYGPYSADEETVMLVITGGTGEKSSREALFVQDCHATTGGNSHMGSDWSKLTLRVDEEANCTLVYQICHKAGIFNPGQTWIHPHYEEAYFVECHGPTHDYLGEVLGHVVYDQPCYLFRPPNSRHGNAQYSPSIIFCKYYSTDLGPDKIFDLRDKTSKIPQPELIE